jgi:aspartate dehydrogenase
VVVDLVVECAGHAAIEEHVLPALERGLPCMVASVGALSAPGMAQRLEEAARRGGTQVQLLSGAIGGIDAIAAARPRSVQIIVRRRCPRRSTSAPACSEKSRLGTSPAVKR